MVAVSDQIAGASAQYDALLALKRDKEMRERGGAVRTMSPVEEELEAAMAERDALLELKREKEEREKAESAAAMARTRSASKAAELAAAKAELARLQSMQGGGGGRMW